MHEGKGELELRIVYHERRLWLIVVRSKFDIWLSSFDDAVMTTPEAF